MTRIGETREVSWKVTAKIGIGHHGCEWCETETPDPTNAEAMEWAQDHQGSFFMWPTPPGNRDGWQPRGWIWYEHLPGGGGGWLCPKCVSELNKLASKAKRKRTQ